MSKDIPALLRNPKQLSSCLFQRPFRNQKAALDTLLTLASDPLSFSEFTQIFQPLIQELGASPDPDMALANLERFTSVIFSRATFYGYLKSIPPLLQLLIKLFGSSQFLSDALIRNPEYLDWLSDASVLEARKEKSVVRSELDQTLKLFPKADSKMQVLRRFKRREMLRIGARDLLGKVPLEVTVEELSGLAEALTDAAVGLAWQECQAKYGTPMEDAPKGAVPARFCVIGMGKLGGCELNYSSDIDVMFVYSAEGSVKGPRGKATPMSTHEFFNRMSEHVIHALATTNKEGYVFRVDTRLRPEGDTGPLARSLESYETYYGTWGEAWEKLALIKARPIAGDMVLGEEFIAMTRPFVYQRHLAASALQEIRHIKQRIESRLATQGKTFTEVKLGYGGIREIEFSIQLLQLIHGAGNRSIQKSNSLETIEALRRAKLLEQPEAQALQDAYRFLRRVEHFLQIVHEMQVHQLPSDTGELTKLAKRMGYEDKDHQTALAIFKQHYQRYTRAVHDFHARIFGKQEEQSGEPDLGYLIGKAQDTKALEYLGSLGFQDPKKARALLAIMGNGPSYMHLSGATVREFVNLLPRLLALLKESPDPDMALNALERIVNSQGARTGFYRLLAKHEKLLQLLVVTAGNSQNLSETFVRHPEFLEALTRDASLSRPKSRESLQEDLTEQSGLPIQVFKEYETLRIGLRDLLGLADLPTVLTELSDLADAVFRHVLQRGLNEEAKHYAVMALGKWGSRELGYHSDLDVIFVCEGDDNRIEEYQKLSQKIIGRLGESTPDGFLYKIDPRLRPGGKSDVLVLPLEGYREYYATRIQTWERQALTRARFVAGDAQLGKRFMAMLEDCLYSRSLKQQEIQEIIAMRERMTKEKVSPGQKGSHVKLDVGGIVDVEFAVQLMQLHWGQKYPVLRHGTTMDIISQGLKEGILDSKSRKTLTEGYLFLRAIENKLRIVSGLSAEVIPSTTEDQIKLVRRLGQSALETFWKKYRDSTAAIRLVFEGLCKKAQKK